MPQKVIGLRQKFNNAIQYRLSRDQQRLDHMTLRLTHPANTINRRQDQMQLLGSKLTAVLAGHLHRHHDRINRIQMHFNYLAPRIESRQGQLALLERRLNAEKNSLFLQKHSALHPLLKALEHLNPHNTLARGFAIVRNAQGAVVSHADALRSGNQIAVELATGHITAKVLTACSFEDSQSEL
jgi:exodeoxyribonuclease VII large subunit